MSDIQDYFKCILENPGKNIDNRSVKIHINNLESRIKFRKNTWKNEIAWKHCKQNNHDKNGENVPNLEITAVTLAHYNIVNNDYQQDSRVLYTSIPNKPLGSLLEISPEKEISPISRIFLKTFNSEFHNIEMWFTDQNRSK